MSHSKGQVAFAILAGCAALLLAYYFGVIVRRGELGQKDAWSVLQRLETDHRKDIPADTPILLKNAVGSGYTVLGLPSMSRQYPRVWFMLNDRDAGGAVKKLPLDVQFSVTCSYVDDIQRRTVVTENVLAYLRSHCSSR